MKKFIIAPVAAVVMLGLSGTAFAQAKGETGVDIYKKINIETDIKNYGSSFMLGLIGVNQNGIALISNNQSSTTQNANSASENSRHTNTANMHSSGQNAAGSVGFNTAAGDNNVQANNAAITYLGSSKGSLTSVLGNWVLAGSSVDAEIGSKQVAQGNQTKNLGNHNDAIFGGGSLNKAAGNVGANVAAGNNNIQANNFAVSYGQNAVMSVSTVDNVQTTQGNNTLNATLTEKVVGTTISVGQGLTLSGNAGISGTLKQSNDVYPEVLIGGSINTPHPDASTYWGHIDFDDKNPNKPGRFEFKPEDMQVNLGDIRVTGNLTTFNTVAARTSVNNAIMNASANGASGHVGVNVAAGTNNLQSNSLALSVGNL